jgi:hypothetical protein
LLRRAFRQNESSNAAAAAAAPAAGGEQRAGRAVRHQPPRWSVSPITVQNHCSFYHFYLCGPFISARPFNLLCMQFLLGSFGAPVADEPVDQLPVDMDVVGRPLRRKLGRDHVQQREDHVTVSTTKTNMSPQRRSSIFAATKYHSPSCKWHLVFAGG